MHSGLVADPAQGEGRSGTLEIEWSCGHCKERAYFYCETCFPDLCDVDYATCNPATGRPCFAKHVNEG